MAKMSNLLAAGVFPSGPSSPKTTLRRPVSKSWAGHAQAAHKLNGPGEVRITLIIRSRDDWSGESKVGGDHPLQPAGRGRGLLPPGAGGHARGPLARAGPGHDLRSR